MYRAPRRPIRNKLKRIACVVETSRRARGRNRVRFTCRSKSCCSKCTQRRVARPSGEQDKQSQPKKGGYLVMWEQYRLRSLCQLGSTNRRHKSPVVDPISLTQHKGGSTAKKPLSGFIYTDANAFLMAVVENREISRIRAYMTMLRCSICVESLFLSPNSSHTVDIYIPSI
jgi:hypothetical protein